MKASEHLHNFKTRWAYTQHSTVCKLSTSCKTEVPLVQNEVRASYFKEKSSLKINL